MCKSWVILLVLLSACSGPIRATPPATPAALRITFTPATQNFTQKIYACSKNHPEIALSLEVYSPTALGEEPADLMIRLGIGSGDFFAAPVGEDTIAVVINADNPVQAITPDNLQRIFAGEITEWAELGGEQQPIQVWAYPAGDDARAIMDKVVLGGASLARDANITPNPQAMLDVIQADPLAIGYIPASWLEQTSGIDKIRPLDINKKLAENLHQPILAITPGEPQGALRALLVCLQSTTR